MNLKMIKKWSKDLAKSLLHFSFGLVVREWNLAQAKDAIKL
ncbi:MAG: hypothetical protein ACI81T_000621 [Bacteroidia bacterium]|jgi:hypothetical protein